MDRYTFQRKTIRNHDIVKYKKTHPKATLKEIANRFEISRQRVFQILNNKYNQEGL